MESLTYAKNNSPIGTSLKLILRLRTSRNCSVVEHCNFKMIRTVYDKYIFNKIKICRFGYVIQATVNFLFGEGLIWVARIKREKSSLVWSKHNV